MLSPFPQLLNTEHPDRVVANLVEGKVVIMTDISPSALIGPVTFSLSTKHPMTTMVGLSLVPL